MASDIDKFAAARRHMIERQLEGRGIRDPRILRAFGEVPRERFISSSLADQAYEDHPLPIEARQTISQPYIVARMVEAAEVKPGARVLEVGAGSGYAAAVLGRIAAQVVAVERHAELVEVARRRMSDLGYTNVRVVQGDGTLGWREAAPYDAILAAASGSHVPQPLLDQLATGGRLVMPIGDPESVQHLLKVTKNDDGSIDRENLGAVRFVPLVGEEGWSDAGR